MSNISINTAKTELNEVKREVIISGSTYVNQNKPTIYPLC